LLEIYKKLKTINEKLEKIFGKKEKTTEENKLNSEKQSFKDSLYDKIIKKIDKIKEKFFK